MTVDREEAGALLNAVEGIEGRVRQLLLYAHVSDYLFLWGTIWFVGFIGDYLLKDRAALLWLALQGIGLIGTVLIVARHRRDAGTQNWAMVARAGISVIAVIGFGTLWLSLFHVGWREEVTFWPTFLSFLLFLVGLWAGRTLALAAVAIFAISLLGYFVATGPYLLLWMAVAGGGSMLAGGVWLRR
ncbi:MAG: hypothetical protein JO348_13385 [Alphaproteobacteria bacterium]|nr:hypothetical protein [Alphaproteobacteria bacterium]